jgi:hypothetical protein
MSGAIPPLPQYTFMAWCSVKAQGLQLYYESLEIERWRTKTDIPSFNIFYHAKKYILHRTLVLYIQDARVSKRLPHSPYASVGSHDA